MALVLVVLLVALAATQGNAAEPPALPGGGVIAYTGVRWASNLGSATTWIYAINGDGSAGRRITAGTHPAWSRDGNHLAFARIDAGGWRLFVADANGRNTRPITKPLGLADAASWSPDGRRIAFNWLFGRSEMPKTGTYAQQVSIVASSGGKLRRLTSFATFKGGTANADWSPDGRLILFDGRTSMADKARTDIWQARPDGRGLKRLIVGAAQPAWSPDGRMIAFTRGGDIYLASAAGKVIRRMTNTPRSGDSHPSWSPDGTRIVFTSYRPAKNDANTTMRVSVVGADGTGRLTITPPDPRFWADNPTWKPAP